ncbi:hypothetical protein BCR34DRAFT_106466 [Clohesyomyces aquaticus]|uniref:Uncharacterized protein n=1 Tax=Clohesyomyces aquaticus TaxID=1231657 RepID=A0A1Y2A1R9_9PLEO|nr:hypothetical protein BCR34DRAFT_106466 [Clohesyomyces aquaticus]
MSVCGRQSSHNPDDTACSIESVECNKRIFTMSDYPENIQLRHRISRRPYGTSPPEEPVLMFLNVYVVCLNDSSFYSLQHFPKIYIYRISLLPEVLSQTLCYSPPRYCQSNVAGICLASSAGCTHCAPVSTHILTDFSRTRQHHGSTLDKNLYMASRVSQSKGNTY